MLVNKENRQKYIQSLARSTNKSVELIELEVERNPDILEGWAEHLANDFDNTSRYIKHYRNNYYE